MFAALEPVLAQQPDDFVGPFVELLSSADLAIGNAIGSNTANIGLVLGAVAMLRPIELTSATLRREMPALLAVSLLTVTLFLDTYLSRCLQAGLTVAICEQVEDPALAKGLVKREVVRVVTPGVIVDDDILDAPGMELHSSVQTGRSGSGSAFAA